MSISASVLCGLMPDTTGIARSAPYGQLDASNNAINPVPGGNASDDAHLVMFGYDYSDQNKYLYNADGSYNQAEYDNYIANIHQPQLKLTINGETCPYEWGNYQFEQWLQSKTYNADAVTQYNGDLTQYIERKDIANVKALYPNFADMVQFNNLSGIDLNVEIEFRTNHYYRVYADNMSKLVKLSDTKYQIVLKPYNPLPVTQPPVQPPAESTGVKYLTLLAEPGIGFDLIASTPFMFELGDGIERESNNDGNGLYTVGWNQELGNLLTASKRFNMRPKTGNNFGSTVLYAMSGLSSWGGYGFDASLTDPAVEAKLMKIVGITDSNVALAIQGDYSAAGNPTIVNGILKTF